MNDAMEKSMEIKSYGWVLPESTVKPVVKRPRRQEDVLYDFIGHM